MRYHRTFSRDQARFSGFLCGKCSGFHRTVDEELHGMSLSKNRLRNYVHIVGELKTESPDFSLEFSSEIHQIMKKGSSK